MAQKVVVKVFAMNDSKMRQKAMSAVADVTGVDSITVDLKENNVTVIGIMDAIKVAKRLIKKLGEIDIISVGPAIEEKKEQEKKPDDKK